MRLVNTGPGTPVWRAESTAEWLTAAPTGGTLAVGETAVRIEVRSEDLEPGTHRGAIRFVVGPRVLSVDVTLVIPTRPEARLDPETLDLGAAGSGSATLANAGGSPLEWSVETPAWITISPASGTLSPGSTISLAVDPDRTALDPGAHEGTVRLVSNGGEDALLVRVEVLAPPRIAVTPAVLDLGPEGTTGTIAIANEGGTAMAWTASLDRPWISLDAASGTVAPGFTETRAVSVDRTALETGRHTATVQLDSDGGNASVQVTIDVTAPASSPSGDSSQLGTALAGTIVGQFNGSGVAGVSVTFAGETVTTDASGSFVIPGDESSTLRDLSVSGSAIVDRETFARNGTGTWLAIPSSFSMTAFNDMAREFEPRTIRWTSNPRVYVDTRPRGFDGGPELDTWIQEAADDAPGFVDAWSDGGITLAGVTVGSDPPPEGTVGWIVVRFSEDPDDFGSTTTVGVARTFWGPDRSILAGTITLRFGDFTGTAGRSTRRAVFGHELGHTFGMGHMDGATPSLMTPAITENDLTGFDHSAGSIVYTRSPGNQHPDRDDATFFRGGLVAAAAPTASHGWVCGDPALEPDVRGR